ncbi:hypothetical protein HAX54_021907, partial [Datura stramonium]|nr:hypothetical protein [Datura stramonium]
WRKRRQYDLRVPTELVHMILKKEHNTFDTNNTKAWKTNGKLKGGKFPKEVCENNQKSGKSHNRYINQFKQKLQ